MIADDVNDVDDNDGDDRAIPGLLSGFGTRKNLTFCPVVWKTIKYVVVALNFNYFMVLVTIINKN